MNSRMNACFRKGLWLRTLYSVTNTSDTRPRFHISLSRISGESRLGNHRYELNQSLRLSRPLLHMGLALARPLRRPRKSIQLLGVTRTLLPPHGTSSAATLHPHKSVGCRIRTLVTIPREMRHANVIDPERFAYDTLTPRAHFAYLCNLTTFLLCFSPVRPTSPNTPVTHWQRSALERRVPYT